MRTKQANRDWDEELEAILIDLVRAKRHEAKARSDLTKARILRDRVERFKRRALKHAAEAQVEQETAETNAAEARRSGQEAWRNGLSEHRWDSGARRWDAVAERLGPVISRFRDEARRKRREIKDLDNDVRSRTEEVTELFKISYSLQQRFCHLRSRRNRGMIARSSRTDAESKTDAGYHVEAAPTPSDAPDALSITVPARGALKNILDRTTDRPDQLLRLDLDSLGGAMLYPDAPGPTDHRVSNKGAAVLVIGPEPHTRLLGKTLDAVRSPSGTEVVLR